MTTLPPATESPLLSPSLLAQLERLQLVSRKIFRGRMKGERRSRRKGQSVEFADFRAYVAGDDTRFVDWNLYARMDKLFLKLFLEEEDLHFYTLVDCSRSMQFGDPTKLYYAKQLAAALGFIGLCRGDRVRVEPISENVSLVAPPFRGRSSLWRMLQHVENLPESDVGLEAGVRNFCLRNRGKGVVVLISDLMDKSGYESALRFLVARNMDAYVVQVLCPEEQHPEIVGDLRLIDCEDQDAADITVSRPLLDRYQRTLAAFIQNAQGFCRRRGIGYVMASTELPVDKLVTSYLRREGLTR